MSSEVTQRKVRDRSKRYAQARKRGVCVRCGKPRRKDGTELYCRQCADEVAKRGREYRKATKSLGYALIIRRPSLSRNGVMSAIPNRHVQCRRGLNLRRVCGAITAGLTITPACTTAMKKATAICTLVSGMELLKARTTRLSIMISAETITGIMC
jgi:hypothetical protein